MLKGVVVGVVENEKPPLKPVQPMSVKCVGETFVLEAAKWLALVYEWKRDVFPKDRSAFAPQDNR